MNGYLLDNDFIVVHISVSVSSFMAAQKYGKNRGGDLFPTIAHPFEHGFFRQPCVFDVFYIDRIVNDRIDNLNPRNDFISAKLKTDFSDIGSTTAEKGD